MFLWTWTCGQFWSFLHVWIIIWIPWLKLRAWFCEFIQAVDNFNLVNTTYLGPHLTRDREPVTITPQALSLVEKAKPVQVQFTLRSRDQRSIWMQDGCKVYMDSYVASKWIMFHSHLDYFRQSTLGGRPDTKPGDHDTPNTQNRCFILFYHVWGPAWIDIHYKSIWWRSRSHMTSHYTWGSMRVHERTT